MKIGSITTDGNIFLAPMAGVTDRAFRTVCKPFGVSMMYTEMVSAKGLYYENKKTSELLIVSECEKPVAAQIFGHEPETMAKVANEALRYGAQMIDINMGCPTPKIVNNGDGCALMKNISLASEVTYAVCKAVNVPVSVKFRAGWDGGSINAVEFAKAMESSGAAAVTVHPRTREQFYSGKADWSIIAKVKASVSIPVIGSGDVVNGETAKEMLSQTGCDGIMIGRAAQGNPWIFKQISHYLNTGEELPTPTLQERITVAKNHMQLLTEYKGENRGIKEGRKHLAWYMRGVPNSSRVKDKINSIQSTADAEHLLNEILYNLN